MRLLISVFFPRSIHLEGLYTLIDSLATSFVRQGVDTTVLAPLGHGGRNGASEDYQCIDYLPSQRVTFHKILFHYVQTMRKLINQFDVVQLIDIVPSFLMLSEQWAARASSVYDLIEGPSISWADVRNHRPSAQHLSHWFLKNRFWARLPRHRCKAYIVSSHYQREQLLSLNIPAERIRVIPFGIHPERIQSFDRTDARKAFGLSGQQVVGYLGHFSPMKGVPGLLAAFEQVALQNSAAALLLAWSGKGVESQKVLSMLERMPGPCRDRVKLVGKVNVSQFMAACDVITLPYISSSIPHFPLVLAEAFAAKVPIVTTRVGGLPEIVKHQETGILVDAGCSGELACALSLLLEDKSLRALISTNAFQAFRSVLNSDVTAAKLLKLYLKGSDG